jgi:hypothetical protein
MSRRMIRGRPSPGTLRKRKLRARKLRASDPAKFYLARRRRKEQRQPEPARGATREDMLEVAVWPHQLEDFFDPV